MESINQKVRDRMSCDHKYPCVWGCKNDVVAVDMPRVTICKACYAKLRKTDPLKASILLTWRQYLKQHDNNN
jgi:hypothetical protein